MDGIILLEAWVSVNGIIMLRAQSPLQEPVRMAPSYKLKGAMSSLAATGCDDMLSEEPSCTVPT